MLSFLGGLAVGVAIGTLFTTISASLGRPPHGGGVRNWD